MSFQLAREYCHGFSIPDEGGKIIPPESDFVLLSDGTTRRHLLTDLKFLEGM